MIIQKTERVINKINVADHVGETEFVKLKMKFKNNTENYQNAKIAKRILNTQQMRDDDIRTHTNTLKEIMESAQKFTAKPEESQENNTKKLLKKRRKVKVDSDRNLVGWIALNKIL